ncbi:acyl-CoA dehydrogenase family protein [Rhodococcus sp. NPDC056960]|uniref:acyl-CoA dehydrogenase family protein n=1 Tax=Rhodococcus sp. NPDC056960 TaxID=3345982 RepID=UPI00363A5842
MTTPTTVDPDLVDMMSAVFAAHREQNEPDTGIATWDTSLWAHLTDLGLTRLTGPEKSGGSGAGWLEAAELLRAAAANGIRTPLAEHDLLAGWLLDMAGLPVDDARRTVCVLDHTGTAHGVPWAAQSDSIVTVWRNTDTYVVADIETSMLTVTPGANLAGEPRDTVTIDSTSLIGTPVAGGVVDQLRLRGALIRAVQTCAALDRILDLSITHATERIQFGRPLAKFQSVQNLVADIAAEAALARAATEAALIEAVHTDWAATNLDVLVAAARSCVGHAVSTVVRNAHQVHGAIGTTREHRLHEFTQPALAWRSEFGSLHHWNNMLTTTAITAGRQNLWSLVTA